MNTSDPKLYYLEGIRGVAAFVVLVAHLKNIFYYDLEFQSLQYFIQISHSVFIGTAINSFFDILLDGKLAVQVFWFMSGYVISIKLFGINGSYYVKAAMIKRYFRLAIPVLTSVLLAYGLMKLGWMYNIQLAEVLDKKENGLIAVYNFEPTIFTALKSGLWDAFFDFRFKGSYNAILWTMGPEIYGSFCCFLLFVIFRTMPFRYLFYTCLALIALLVGYYWLVTFILGFTLCDIDHTENKLKKIFLYFEKNVFCKWYYGIPLLAVLVIMNGFGQQYYSAYAKIVVSAMGVFIVMRSSYLRNIFSQPLVVWLGKLSFAIYLIHLPILYSFTCYLYLQLGLGLTYGAIVSAVITIIVVLLAAIAFTKWIDQPSIWFSNRIAKFILKR